MRTLKTLAPFIATLSVISASALGKTAIGSVRTSPAFFNPSVGQSESISVEVRESGTLSVAVLDRDGFLVRVLAVARPVDSETYWFQWDGRDDAAKVVPDEAYSLKVEHLVNGRTSLYLPASSPAEEVAVKIKGYNRQTGVLSYSLTAPSRVHAQAGISEVDQKTGTRDGPVLKTIANREPRPAGAVIENWDGFDQTGAFFVPDLPHFAVAVAATALPENSMIVIGNTSRTFLESVAQRSGASLLPPTRDGGHRHHRGLSALDDVSPELLLTPLNGRWSDSAEAWAPSGEILSAEVTLAGPTAESFARQPAVLEVYLDGRRIDTIRSPTVGKRLVVPLQSVVPGAHHLALNWSSDYGPVAVTSLRIRSGTATRPVARAEATRGEAMR